MSSCRRVNNNMKNIRPVLFLALMTLLALPVLTMPARAENDELEHAVVLDTGKVKEILSSDMIMLGNDKRYRLDNILVPPFEDGPAIDELNREFLNRVVTVYAYHDADGRDPYSHGLPLVQVVTDAKVWVQEDLVSKGLVWAFSSETSQEMADTLKLVEDSARLQRLGFWKNPAYAIKTPKTVKKFMNSYQIVEGKILSVNVEQITGTTYLNFGKNWKTDFVVRIRGNPKFLGLVKDPKADKDFDEDPSRPPAFNPRQWENRIVRVRGWVHGISGPVIDVNEKEQVDFVQLDTDSAGDK